MGTSFPLATADEKQLTPITRTTYGSAILCVDLEGVLAAAGTTHRADVMLGLSRAVWGKTFGGKK